MVAARGCPAVEVPALFWHGEEEGGQWGWVGQKAKWAGWLLGRLGQKLKKNPFGIKIGFLNLPRL
jgi:hypothetical protein